MNNSINKYLTKSKKNEIKYYETWKGNNKFCLNGKIYIGSEYYYGLLTFIYLLINYIFYLLFIIKVSKYNFLNRRDLKKIICFYMYMRLY